MNSIKAGAESSYSTHDPDDLSYARVAQSLARDYIMVYHVDIETGDFVKYTTRTKTKELVVGLEGSDFFGSTIDEFANRIYPEDREPFRTAATKENVLRVLAVDRSFILNFRIMQEGKPVYYEVKATRMSTNDERNIVIGVMDVSAHMERVNEYEQARRNYHTFASILEAMASDYLRIFYVNLENDEYVEYNPKKTYRKNGPDGSGSNFFDGRWNKLVLSQVYDEDQRIVFESFSKEGLKKTLADQPTLIIICRLVIDGNITFVSIKATRMEGEEGRIVIGVSDIDEQVRREEAHAEALGAAQAIANRDPLTGVKSKHAFTEAELVHNQMIKGDVAKEFCIVVCDVNGLKEVNDTYGHKAGDELIKQASALICKQFKHSPVYRVGGDEFVAILGGSDYENRQELIDDLNKKVEENQRNGEVVIAVGSSDYTPYIDRGFLPVFERADAAMYIQKSALKGLL